MYLVESADGKIGDTRANCVFIDMKFAFQETHEVQTCVCVSVNCTHSHSGPKSMKQTMTNLQGEINSSIIRFGDFNTPLLMMIEHMERTAIRTKSILKNYHTTLRSTYGTLTREYPTFSRVHGMFSGLDPILGHNTF